MGGEGKLFWGRDNVITNAFCALQAVCVAVAALMQYFLMAAFCWMLVEGIYLYLYVVKVYNINNKMTIYHVLSWGTLCTIFICHYCWEHQLQLVLAAYSRDISLFHCRFPCFRGRHFAEHCCRKRWNTDFCQWQIVRIYLRFRDYFRSFPVFHLFIRHNRNFMNQSSVRHFKVPVCNIFAVVHFIFCFSSAC